MDDILRRAMDWVDTLPPEVLLGAQDELRLEREKRLQQEKLSEFVKGAWGVLEPGRPLVWNWHLDVVCGYLEAVWKGRIRRLIVNIPPGSMKSLLVSVFYPSWVWVQDPSHRFLCGSNEGTLATRDALRMRNLVSSEWYKSRWGERVELSGDQQEKGLFTNTSMGHRESQGVAGRITGKRGDTILWDDPHDTKETESDIRRETILEAWDMAWSSRMNDPDSSAAILIMQRIHQKDITGHLLGKRDQNWVRLAIPMRYDPDLTYDAGADIDRPELNDPRREAGELLFPARYSEQAVMDLESDLGAYGSAGQLQQRPSPKGGGEFRVEWIRRWKTRPRSRNCVILVDPAGERKPGRGKKDNTAMGVFVIGEDGNYYLIDGYRDRLNLVERADILFKWHRDYKPLAVGYEQYGMQSDIAHLQDRMEREDYRFRIIELGGGMAKEDRIRRLIPLFERGRIWFPDTLYRTNSDGKTVDIIDRFIEEEYKSFPVASRDDFLDMISRLVEPDLKLASPKRSGRSHLRVVEHSAVDSVIGW